MNTCVIKEYIMATKKKSTYMIVSDLDCDDYDGDIDGAIEVGYGHFDRSKEKLDPVRIYKLVRTIESELKVKNLE